MKNNAWQRWAWLGILGLALAAQAAETPEDAARRVFADAKQAAKSGPQDIAIASQARLHLPAGHIYIAQPHATQVLNAMGNPGQDARLQGLVFPEGEGNWFVTLRYEDSGHIKDDDAKDWKADELLKSYREGTEAANAERQKMGVPGIEIVGWAQQPAYDAATHRLVWAMSSREKGAAAGQEQGVNYNTYALGREGYFSLNLVTGLDELPKYKASAHRLLTALEYDEGKRYQDFTASTDRVAEYGLAALVVGVGAKKLGFFALAAALFAKFAKVAIFGALALGAGAMKLFGRNKPKA